jgi:hypothetical protein
LSHKDTKAQRPARFTRHTSGGQAPGGENENKLNNEVFSLMNLRLINFNVPRINAPQAH